MNRLNLTLLLSTGLIVTAVLTSESTTDKSDKNIITPIENTVQELSLDTPAKGLDPSTSAPVNSDMPASG